jgi:pimeloyl-ACP methyl ester carboxylesterase
MATTTVSTKEIKLLDTTVEYYVGGTGPTSLVFLHGAGGNSGWQSYHDQLAQLYTVYVPSQAGFNGTERPDWVYTITDMAHFNLQLISALNLQDYILMGSSMGGWIASEMASMDDSKLKSLILIDAAGIRPETGEIAEIFMCSAQTRLKQRFYDPKQVENYENYTRDLTPEEIFTEHSNREMASRLCWKPYLHNWSLPFYLKKISIPTLIIWGDNDAIIPVECGTLFQKSIAGSKLEIIKNCGHSPAIEKPVEFMTAVNNFLANS